jgi:hypothetical protein
VTCPSARTGSGRCVDLSLGNLVLKVKISILLGIVLVISLDVYKLFVPDFAVGIDGYYYVIQTQSYTDNGSFYYPTNTPLVLFFIQLANRILVNPIASIKLSAVLFEFLLILGLFAIIYETLGSITEALMAGLLFLISGLHLYLLVEYLDQLGALVTLIWAIYFCVRFFKTRYYRWLAPALLLLLAASFAHKSIWAIAITIIIVSVLFWIGSSFSSRPASTYYFVFCILLCLLTPLLLKFQHFASLSFDPNNEITFTPHFPSHFSTLPDVLILIIAVSAVLWILIYHRRDIGDRLNFALLGILALWSTIVTLNPFLSSSNGFLSVGGRLRILTCIQIAILLPVLMRIVRRHVNPRTWLPIAACVCALYAWSFFSPLPTGIQKAFLTDRQKLIATINKTTEVLDNRSFVIAAHGDEFLVSALSGVPSSQKFPSNPGAYESIYWLISGVPITMVDNNMKVLFSDRTYRQTVLVRHDEKWLERLGNSDLRATLFKTNPHLYDYLVLEGK